jgi:hypothetical protein
MDGSCFPEDVITLGVIISVDVPLGVTTFGVDCAFAGVMLPPPHPAL